MPETLYTQPLAATCGKEILGENHTPARSLLYSVRIGYAAHSRRKPASPCRQAVAGPRLLFSLSAALSATIKIAAPI